MSSWQTTWNPSAPVRLATTHAQPAVSGKRVVISNHSASRGGPTVLGTFSSHWAAVAALVRIEHPDFRSSGGDKPEDLHEEARLRERLSLIRRLP